MAKRYVTDPNLQSETKKFLELGCEQLDIEMEALVNESASLIAQWILWEMASSNKTFEEVSIELCRRHLRRHMIVSCVNAGQNVQEHLDSHVVGDA